VHNILKNVVQKIIHEYDLDVHVKIDVKCYLPLPAYITYVYSFAKVGVSKKINYPRYLPSVIDKAQFASGQNIDGDENALAR
jgi:hypothetical protein